MVGRFPVIRKGVCHEWPVTCDDDDDDDDDDDC